MARIYTKKGDDGSTSLWYGGRVPKSDARTEAYGSLDEAASALGVARSICGPEEAEIAADVLRIQNDLFIAGAELATAPEAAERLEAGVSSVTADMADSLDGMIDRYMDRVAVRSWPVGLASVAAHINATPHPLQVLDFMCSDDVRTDVTETVQRFQPEALGLPLHHKESAGARCHTRHYAS